MDKKAGKVCLLCPEETTFERADFTLKLLRFVTAEKERRMFIILFFPVYYSVSCCSRDFKLGEAERAKTIKAQTNWPKSQLFLK